MGHTLGLMPSKVKSNAQRMGASLITGKQWQPNGFGGGGIYVERATYDWDKSEYQIITGRKKSEKYLHHGGLPAGLAPKLRTSHKTDIYAGMRRMEQKTDNQNRTGYLTFRTMSESSSGWIIPAKPGQYVARDIAERAQNIFDDRMNAMLDRVREAMQG